MRPLPAMQRMRSMNRVIDVVVGAAAAIALTALGAPDWAYALAVLVGVAAYDVPGEGEGRFWERVLETSPGVAAAAGFGLLLPAVLDRYDAPPGR